ncbi:hypothetical protein P154DRAFT_567986 [Amniculicola lignicola CBS 123094]|uniref:Protein kinase domain-containing protein n=1 Tax=Amniculicola lignicola CBS 123094 TaxID=1392246 RepID=A0A6A5VUK8_9PLEO|nr:hypothetical protein P154DRAFT_567986 [Amniculicola lignicola CBS 123094]
MGSPFQITLDIADVCRCVKEIATTLNGFSEDLDTIEVSFRRELGRTESCERVVSQPRFGKQSLLEIVGDLQRQSILESFTKVIEHWKKFNTIITACRADPASASAVIALVRRSSSWKIRKRTSWMLGGKEKATKVLATVEQLNQNLSQDITWTITHFGGNSTIELEGLEASDDAQIVGIPSTVTLQKIERDQSFADKNILIPSGLLHTVDQPTVSGENLKFGKFRDAIFTLVEHRYYTQSEKSQLSLPMALRLATFLNRTQAEGTGILQCIGMTHEPAYRRFSYIFDFSPLTGGRLISTHQGKSMSSLPKMFTLREQLKRGGPSLFQYTRFGDPEVYNPAATRPLSSTHRVSFAASLARTLSNLHVVSWLHQSIQSGNILFTIDSSGQWCTISRPYLVGFQFARSINEYSDRYGVRKGVGPEQYIYKHPDRHHNDKREPSRPHNLLDDIYSLGVVFLEIGLGREAVELYNVIPTTFVHSVENADDTHALWRDGKGLTAEQIRNGFIMFATEFLPERMGNKYASIVVACLKGDFEEGGRIGEEANVRIAFRSTVVDELEKLATRI